jgi:hypothetical protein
MKTTIGRIKKLINEDLFDYTGKNSEKKVGGGTGDARMRKIGANVNMLKTTVEKLEHAVMDGNEELVSQLLNRVKQFTKAAEQAMYGQN